MQSDQMCRFSPLNLTPPHRTECSRENRSQEAQILSLANHTRACTRDERLAVQIYDTRESAVHSDCGVSRSPVQQPNILVQSVVNISRAEETL